MKIYLGADHRGYQLKEKIARFLFEKGYSFEDMGALSFNPDDDYPVFAEKVASMVASEPENKGILICGSGVGVSIVANKFDNIRAGLGISEKQVESSRRDDDINILALAADFTNEAEALKMVLAFLETRFSGEEKHKRRLEDITRIEANN
ncbi:MAG: ribose 5-phosphate isomerase B [Patescibacteria group bacterium]|nr:MAG: ribose 5-phosphate isomerase B [Patescibacteria group bacterium]